MNMFRRGRGRRAIAVVAIVVGSLGLAACSTGSGSSPQPTSSGASAAPDLPSFTVGVSQPTVNSTTAQFALMNQLGYWRAEGLKPNLVFFNTSALVLQAMASGAVDIGMSTPDLVIDAAASGQDVDMIYNWQFKPGAEFAVLPNSPIKSAAGFAHKTIGVQVVGSGPQQTGEAVLDKAGVDSKSVTYVAVGTGAPALAALQSHQVDGLLLYDSLYASMETAANIKLRIIPPTGAENLFSTGFVTSHAFAKAHPDIISAWGLAWSKASVWAQANPTEAMKLMFKDQPMSQPDPNETTALKIALAAFQSRQQSLYGGNVPAVQTWGEYPAGAIQDWIDFMKKYDGFKGNVTASDLYTNQFVKAYNNFDPAKIKAAAKAYKG
jgi:NitT/TauT family transport system substrate-binding protein